MESPEQSAEDRVLASVLTSWRVDAEVHPRFQEQVWDRIALAESSPARGAWQSWVTTWMSAICRPRFATGFLTVLAVAGVLGGSLTAQAQRQRVEKELSYRYVHAVDPQLMAGTRP